MEALAEEVVAVQVRAHEGLPLSLSVLLLLPSLSLTASVSASVAHSRSVSDTQWLSVLRERRRILHSCDVRLDTCISGFTMSTTSLVKSFSSSLRVEWWNENRSAQACSSLVANLFGTCLVGKRSTSSSSLSEDKIPLVKRFLACLRHKVHKLAQQNVTGHCITLLVYIVVWFLVSLCPVWLRVFKAHSLVLNNTNIWSDCIKL